ncbi:MAG TPA: Holliday junction branch migration protein RuvA [Lentimicrobium sp.]|nr:Holliday junction branch migration protein RuvA [Lentimicrobium sp.]
MYAFLQGVIESINPATVVLNCNGIGYDISISLNTYSLVKGKNECRLLTHLVVREDAHILFGFANEDERMLFRHLISVSGVGANTARLILSSLTPADVTEAIVNGKVAVLQKVKGIGGKTAQRVIIDLKDKLVKDSGIKEILGTAHNTTRDEALSALTLLGFNKSMAEKTVDKIIQEEGAAISVEYLIKSALKMM